MRSLVIVAILAFGVPAAAQSTATIANGCVRVTGSSATLRGRPVLTAKALDIVAKNAQLESIAKRDTWVLVQSEDYVGWVEEKWLEPCVAGTVSRTPVLGPAPASSAPPVSSPAAPAANPTQAAETRTYSKGPRGGCYYLNSSGRKIYVDHSLCGE
jgi:hypothetical protein